MNSPCKVISVGIQPATSEGLKSELSPGEFQLQSAEDLEELVEILKKGIPDIVYLSADTKRVDPFGLCSRLSKTGAGVLLISQSPTRELLIKAARHGAMDVLVFPFKRGSVGLKTDRALIKIGKKTPPEGLERKIDFGTAKTPFDKMKLLIMLVKEVLALPFAVVKIIRLCNDPSSNAGDLEKPVMSDPAIAAMIMQRANSAAFGGVGRISGIQTAVMRIGMKATRNIAASFSVFKLFSKEEKSFGFNRIWFWVHSLTTGICAQVLATLLKHRHPEDAFLAGLLHDIGKMVLDDFMNQEFETALRMANAESIPMWKAEKAIFEANHAYVGSKIAEAWGFPPVVAEGIGRHHFYENLEGETGELSIGGIVCLANQMAKALRAGSGGDHLAEREATAMWKRFPKGLAWRKITEKVVQELKAYTDVLEIPPEQFEMELPEESKGRAGIFLPRATNNGILLQIALEREGFETVAFSSLDEKTLKDGFSVVIGDFTHLENSETAVQLQKVLSSLTEKTIIVPTIDEKNRPTNLDFFWLESQLKTTPASQ
ncbi:MAG: hypothetical protein CVU57_04975 [Deltaproteobacteria bacterium HGW-Deltaproteobacteria-15]|jgi:putative nucleotidyltransferase with HDIG domain|nr:MAG: hypothetical protein CVU57_04975 [Deltaproteobacteria bacterium HGW-Deltaproteobacteria-15]